MEKVNVIGAGLAGVEATYQLVRQGIPVRLYEMRPVKTTDAHKTDYFAELVCSNSLRADGLNNAVGVLKEEMQMDNMKDHHICHKTSSKYNYNKQYQHTPHR